MITELNRAPPKTKRNCSNNGGVLVRFAVVGAGLGLHFGQLVLLVEHAPLEDAAEVRPTLVDGPVLEVLVIDAVDQRHRHRRPVQVDRVQQRWQPVGSHLAVSVQKQDHLSKWEDKNKEILFASRKLFAVTESTISLNLGRQTLEPKDCPTIKFQRREDHRRVLQNRTGSNQPLYIELLLSLNRPSRIFETV